MTPTPRALELLLCRQVIVDSLTGEPSCIGIKTSLTMPRFPSPPQDLAFFTSLTDGIGEGELELVINSFRGNETIYRDQRIIGLSHRLAIANTYGNLRNLVFPYPDVYGILILVDGELTTIRHIAVREKKP